MDELGMDPEFARRYLNEGFSGGEKKRAEVLQWPCSARRSRSSTRPTAAWTSTPCGRLRGREPGRRAGTAPASWSSRTTSASSTTSSPSSSTSSSAAGSSRTAAPSWSRSSRRRATTGSARSTPRPPATRTSWRPRRRPTAGRSAFRPTDRRAPDTRTSTRRCLARTLRKEHPHGDRSEQPGRGHQGRVQVRLPRLGRPTTRSRAARGSTARSSSRSPR